MFGKNHATKKGQNGNKYKKHREKKTMVERLEASGINGRQNLQLRWRLCILLHGFVVILPINI